MKPPLFFPEMLQLEKILKSLPRSTSVRTGIEGEVRFRAHGREMHYPLHTVVLGSRDPQAPTVGFVGGVHGLERIGAQVVIAYLESIAERLGWDESLARDLERIRVIFMPIVNPAGIALLRRSNAQHVDLMRNSPVVAEGRASFLVGGHRISPRLPWYMGQAGAPMQQESQALCDFVRRETFASKATVMVDVHSGFGLVDRLWFPFARSPSPFPEVAEIYALKGLFDRAYANHIYRFEPQSKTYTTHGDLWDYLYDERRRAGQAPGAFLPLTLEMGSWSWVKKNPLQLFSFLGAFNPVKPHRQKRTLRRHLVFFEFLFRAALSPGAWADLPADARRSFREDALRTWFADPAA